MGRRLMSSMSSRMAVDVTKNEALARRRAAPNRTLEKRFFCFAFIAIAAFCFYGSVLHTRNYDDSSIKRWYDDSRIPVERSRPRNDTLRRIPVAHRKYNRSLLPPGEASDAGVVSPDYSQQIPSFFTSVDEQWLHNGRVVRELSHRVLSRNIAQSNVVIVSPNFGNEAHAVTNRIIQHDSTTIKDMAMHYYPAQFAMEQGHTTHLLPSSTNFAEGWHTSSGQNYNSTSVGWILLAYFATQNLDSSGQDPPPTIDSILAPSRDIISWLHHTTITYLVFPVSAMATIPLSSILGNDYEYEMDYIVDKTVEMTGLTAAKTLLGENYKLQLLASSHYFDEMDDDKEAHHYGPNALFQSAKALHRFLYERATRALRIEVSNIRRHHQQSRQFNADDAQMLEVQFHSLLFATQGLDLAIPSRSSYVDVGNHTSCQDPQKGRKERCDPKLNARAFNDAIFLECPKRHESLKVQFVDESDLSDFQLSSGMSPNDKNFEYTRSRRVNERTSLEKLNGIAIDIDDRWMKDADEISGEVEVWSGTQDPSQSEAVCVKVDKSAILPRVSCKTRIIPIKTETASPNTNNQLPERPNLLVVMIDPLSRQQLKRSLPNTWALLELMGFTNFPYYTAVGNNSGPNQAALFSGLPLTGRQGIRASNESSRRVWLWDRLNAAGYMTLKAEDGCIRNRKWSNMVQSINPQTHHGKQLHEMFCFSYDRPNCLGGKLAAEHLIDYTRQFIETYNRDDDNTSAQTKPWAAFLSFIDSHEDSLTLISYLDGILLNFLQEIISMKNTMILFLSDHGLHYGPTFSSKSGEVERAQPILHMRMPSFQKLGDLRQNREMYTTAFDVHETLLDVLLLGNHTTSDNQLGTSLVQPLPNSRRRCKTTQAIPSKFCSLLDDGNQPQSKCNFMIDPPSTFSFYSDIPKNNRPQWPNHCPIRRNHTMNAMNIVNGPCFCATNDRDWFDCSTMSRNDFHTSINRNTENFSLRSCSHHELDQSLEFEIHVTKNEQVANARKALAAETVKNLTDIFFEADIKASFDSQPNIIFLEIDSVSLSFSERYFPQTWGLLNRHKIVTEEQVVSCPTGWCAGVFNRTSVVGQSSIVNQLAALSGCMDHDDSNEVLKHYKNGPQTHCPAGGKHSFGINEEGVSRDHWIFDVAKNLGYMTFFGEEFCYEDSPYVVQTQSAFTLDVDLTLDKLFCHFAKDWLRVNGKSNSPARTWAVEFDDKDVPDTCFDGISRGEISLEFIHQMFDKYPDLPKFAFLNALAAHDYSLNAARASLSAEHYDGTVYNFIMNIMAKTKNDTRDTYIVLRSDHGLQGGPYPVDYSTQIEHMHPWTAIIAPAKHKSLSIGTFSSNQNRLATGFDIYHSLRYLMSPSLVKGNGEQKSLLFDAGIPRWSYNLFQQTIPLSRKCHDAKIPKEFCPCVGERNDMAPSFYVGHSEQLKKSTMPLLKYAWRTRRFAAARLPGLLVPKYTQKYDVSSNMHVLSPRCNATLGSYIDEEILQDSWRLIHNTTSLFPGSDVSGGVFLYPRQVILLVYLIQREISSRAAKNGNSNNLETFRICETGFGSGHSAALFLSAAPNVEVVSFDKFDRPYQSASFHALRGYFGEQRLTRVFGDSCETVKSYRKQCDFLHGSSLCRTDNIDLIHKSGAGVTLTSTAMNSLQDKSVYFGKTPKWAVAKYGEDAQWATLQKKGCIKNIACFEEEERTIEGNLHLAAGKKQQISHKFCFAVSTGSCSSDKQPAITSSWRREDFCPDWMLSHPILETHKLGVMSRRGAKGGHGNE